MKHHIAIRFYEELNDFLSSDNQKQDIFVMVDKECTVGILINSFGPPDSSVDLILVNGRAVNFSYKLKNNDRISVYPVFESMDISSISRLRDKPLRDLKFICDVHLGKLAKYLRMLGFDTWYENDCTNKKLIDLSVSQARIVLTRNELLLKNGKITRRYIVKHFQPNSQILEIVNYFDLKGSVMPLSRCLICNGTLRKITKPVLKQRVKHTVLDRYDTFYECSGCSHIYWKGTHYESMLKWICDLVS